MDSRSATVPAEQCAAPAAHLDAWHIEGGLVVCSLCRPASTGTIAGGWHDVESVLMSLPVVREALRRTLERSE